mgnify:CR=1 FL=1
MVCPRCIAAVKDIFESEGIHPLNVVLGEVRLSTQLSENEIENFSKKLKADGFELLESGKSKLISQIKSAIIEQIHHSQEMLNVNFSTFLSEKLNHEYSYLSRLFSSVEGVTIEKYITAQKIEKVKELLFYDEKNLSEIAYQLNYSSVAHLSSQFKKETGMTPTAYKKQNSDNRKMLDQI